jgi:DegV family protein with EDD domain
MSIERVNIVADTAGISPIRAKPLGIKVAPIIMRYGEEEFKEGVDISSEDFLKMVMERTELSPKDKRIFPKTAASNIQTFETIFSNLLKQDPDKHIIYVSTIGTLSSLKSNGETAAKNVNPEKITVVNSATTAEGTSYMVEKAVHWAREGLDRETVKRNLNDVKEKITVIANLQDVSYLKASGRGFQIKAELAVAGLLGIQPIIKIDHDEMRNINMPRTRNKSIEKIIEKIMADISNTKILRLMYGGSDRSFAEVTQIAEYVKKYYNKNIPIYPICVSLLVHAGPNIIGALIVKK